MSIFERFTGQRSGAAGDKKRKSNLQAEFKSLLQENTEWAREAYAVQDAEGNEVRDPELEKFLETVQKGLAGHMPERIVDEESEEEIEKELVRNATCLFHISEDRMKAFACILPPINGGADMDYEVFQKELRYAGIVHGIDGALVKKAVAEEDYLSPFLVAAGTPAQDGSNGVVSENFQRKARLNIDVKEGEIIDFSEEITMQIIKKDSIICSIKAAEKAVDGKDVVGNVLKGTDGVDVEVTAGPHTYLSASGRELLAEVDGVVSITEAGDFCVEPQRSAMGSAGRHTGNLYHKGDLYIEGNVSGDIVIKADGDIIIGGEAKDAQIMAGGNVRIQKGISKGQAETIVKAGGQVQCAAIENVTIIAGADVYAGVIMNSDVTAEGSVFATSDRGLLIGGDVKAKKNVSAKEIGNISECKNFIKVGYDPALRIKIDELKQKIKDGEGTLGMLQKNITTLKAVGASHLPPDKKELLAKLEEQRTLYEDQAEELKAEIKTLSVTLHKSSNGTVSCEKMYPTTEVYIGEKKTVVQRLVEPCRVFITGDNIVVR